VLCAAGLLLAGLALAPARSRDPRPYNRS
jgi:hypothetical protein